MFKDFQYELEMVAKSEQLLRQDIEYLAQQYIEGNTDIDLPSTPIVDDDKSIPELSFYTLFKLVKSNIRKLNCNIFIDDKLLHGYIDYYFDIIKENKY
jgi:hypothetical protein